MWSSRRASQLNCLVELTWGGTHCWIQIRSKDVRKACVSTGYSNMMVAQHAGHLIRALFSSVFLNCYFAFQFSCVQLQYRTYIAYEDREIGTTVRQWCSHTFSIYLVCVLITHQQVTTVPVILLMRTDKIRVNQIPFNSHNKKRFDCESKGTQSRSFWQETQMTKKPAL